MKLALRIIGYLTLLGLGFALIQLPKPLVPEQRGAVEATASVDPMPLNAYCPGPLAEVGGEQGTDLGAIERVGKATFNLWGADAQAQENGGLLVSVEGKEQSTKLLSANQTQAISRERLSGLAASYCPMPQVSGYFVVGDSGPGSESVLHLANPNDVDLMVDLELVLESEVATDRISLAAGEHKLVSLVALSSAESSFVLRYQTSGLPVAAFMQLREVSGLSATGVALVPPTQPISQGAIAGLVVGENAIKSPTLRVFNPGLEDVELNLQAINSDDFELIQIRVPAGVLLEETLNLPAGVSLISFEAASELVLSVRNDVISPKVDFEWLLPTSVFERDLYLQAPGSTELVISNPGLEPINLIIESSTSQEVSVAGRSSLLVPIERGPLKIAGSGFMASLNVLSNAGYAVIQPTEMRNIGESIQVFVR